MSAHNSDVDISWIFGKSSSESCLAVRLAMQGKMCDLWKDGDLRLMHQAVLFEDSKTYV